MLYQSFLNNPNSSSQNAYKSYRNKLTHSLRVAKRLYYEKQIEKLKSNVKATWKVLNEILNRNKGKRGCHLYLGQILEKFPIQRK